ncbi:MAG: nucleoside monophosphate kinase [Opitutales bacterium]
MKNKLVYIVLVSFLGLLGCSKKAAKIQEVHRDGILFIGTGADSESLDPHCISENSEQSLLIDSISLESIPNKIVWLSGAPGAGKGTNERYIIEYGHLCPNPLIASSLFNTPEMREKINRGVLLDDATVISSVFNALQDPIYKDGVVVDGFPRTQEQVYSIYRLYRALKEKGYHPLFSVIVLTLDEDESVRRQLYRGERAKEHNERILKSGQGVLQEVRQTDLDPEIARQRYQIFMQETFTALQSLKGKMPFVTIDAKGNFHEVKERVLAAVKLLKLDAN